MFCLAMISDATIPANTLVVKDVQAPIFQRHVQPSTTMIVTFGDVDAGLGDGDDADGPLPVFVRVNQVFEDVAVHHDRVGEV